RPRAFGQFPDRQFAGGQRIRHPVPPLSRAGIADHQRSPQGTGAGAARRPVALMAEFDPLGATIPQLQAAFVAGITSSRALVAQYLARIDAYDQRGPALNAICAINPEAPALAEACDRERAAGGARGPPHGIPIVVKDNYETQGMQTAAGSVL